MRLGRYVRRHTPCSYVVAFSVAGLAMLALPYLASAQTEPASTAQPPAAESGDEDATAIAKKLQNPIADLISVPFQENANFGYGPQKGTQNILNIQPVVPFHLNELSPAEARGTFPGFTYQLGNLISAGAAQMEAAFATHFTTPSGGANYAVALSIIMLIVFAAVAILAGFGYERHSVEFAPEAAA